MNTETVAVLIPIVAIISTFVVVGLAIYFRYRFGELRHQERMSAIEKGMDLPVEPTLGRNAYLLRGLIYIAIGAGMAVFFLAVGAVNREPKAASVAALGLVPLGIGVAYLVVYRKMPDTAATDNRSMASSRL